MKILHTSDWHLTKTLARRDRSDEYEAVLDEVVGIADDHEVDLVVHSGDLFDRAVPPPDAIRLALTTLVRLTNDGARPVVVVAGNHDSPRLFEALAPVLRPLGVHLVGELRRPEEGGALTLETSAGPAVVCCVPFVSQGRVVDFMDDKANAFSAFSDRMQAIVRTHHEYAVEHAAGKVSMLVSHFMTSGVQVQGGKGRTGMKELSIGEAFAVTDFEAHDFSYVALGHIHLPQPVPGKPTGEYAGSLLQLDFGEAGEQKRVVIVDAQPDRPASIETVPLGAGRRLVQASGTWDDLLAREDLGDAWLDLTIQTEVAPSQQHVDEWKEQFPRAVKIRAAYDVEERPDRVRVSGRGLDEVYADYHESVHGEVEAELMDLFREILSEASR